MTSPSMIQGEIQVAVYASLAANSAFMTAIGNRLYDNAPSGTTYPMAMLAVLSNDDSRKTENAESLDIDVHVWSQYGGSKEAMDIVALAHAVLHKHPSAGSGTNVNCFHLLFKNCPLIVDPDGITRHAIARFTALAQPRSST